MEETVVESVAVDETASTVETGDPVSIENIFTDDGPDKKVIVLQSQASNSDPSGGLPDLTDAVADPSQPQAASEVPYAPQAEMPAEENHSESAETVSAPETYEELNNSTEASAKIDQHDPNFVTEVVQDIHTIPQDSEEVIFLDEEQVKDQDIQFIEMASEIAPESIEQTSETVMENVVFAPQQQAQVSGFKRELGRPLRLSETIQPVVAPRKTTFISKEDIKTRFLCPVCEKSFRQKHLLLCHLKLHDSPAKIKSTSVYMSNCTTCGGNVRLTSEQARLLQERGTEDARIICSTCKLLGHDVMQPKTQNTPIELKPAFNFNCDLCGCDIKLTDDQLQLVDRKGAENIRIICAPCSTKDQESIPTNPGLANFKCTSCQRTIVVSSQESIDVDNPTCAECQAKYASEENAAVENMQEEPVSALEEPDLYQYTCTICSKESYMNAEPQTPSDLICPNCKIPERYRRPAAVRQPTTYRLTPTGRQPRFPHVKGVRELKPPDAPKVDGLAVMYKCNSCFCSMQVSEEQKQVLKARGVSGLKIICSACNSKGKPSPAKKKMNLYQCDICLNDMDIDYVPSHDDDDIICQTCRKAEQKDRMKKAKGDLFKCVTCNKYLPLTNTQMNKILQRNVRPNLQCDPCRKKNENDVGKKYGSLSGQKVVDYRCDICSLHFGSNFDKFANHFEKMHIPAKTQAPKKMTIRCPICEYNFTDRDKLKLHIRTHKPRRLMQRPCPFCGEKFAKKTMYEHYKNTHSINIENEMYIFKYADEFKNWKEETEASTCSKFICTEQKANVVKNMPTINLKCQWASLYKTKLVKSRTCVFCPANIEIRVTRNGIFTVNFTKTHVGHELLSDDFSLEEIELMRGYLREGKTVDDIVNELCKELNTESEEYSRFYQLKNYDEYCLSLKLGDIDLIRKFKREDMSEDSVGGASDCDLKADWVDLPKALDFLKDDALNAEQSNSIDTPQNVTATIDIEGTADDISLTFQAPPIVEQFPFGQKKMDVLQRMTALLNKCSADEHFDILDIYLSPCEQTLTELTSGKKVEVVGDDELEDMSEAQNDVTGSQTDVIESQNDATEVEDVTSATENEVTIEEASPPLKRAKTGTE